jgi:hypothetical protein
LESGGLSLFVCGVVSSSSGVCSLAVLLPMWDVFRAVSWCTVHLVVSLCGVTVTSLSLCIFLTVGFLVPISFESFQAVVRGCFPPYSLLRGVTMFTYFPGEYVLWSGVVCPRAWALWGF